MKIKLILCSCTLILMIACSDKERQPKEIPAQKFSMCAPITTDTAWYSADNKAPIIDGLDVLNFSITTSDSLVQKYFNQGLVLAYGFNHAEAARSFYYATKLDPKCAMAYWGFAYVLGPNYNAGMEADNYERAYEAVQKAVELSDQVSPKEKALISALAKRYVKEPIEDRSALDVAYSNAMKRVYKDFANDADVASLYAESIMDLHPWDLWDKEGNTKEWTPEIIRTLEHAHCD